MATEQEFKDALARWASGVAVVCTRDPSDLVYGLTVSSFSSLSLDPPLILACIANRSRFLPMVQQSGRFAVSILHRDQEAMSNAFARPGREPAPACEGVEVRSTPSGQPVVEGAMAWLDCTLHDTVVAGDHTVVIGRVEASFAGQGDPLLYYRRAYRTVTG